LEEEMQARDEGEPLFVFQVAATLLAVDAQQVDAVLPEAEMTPVPCTPPYVLGLVPYGESTLPIIDPARFLELGVESAAPDGVSRRVVVLSSGALCAGLLCERAAGVVLVERAARQPATVLTGGRLGDFLQAEFETAEARVGLIEVASLLDAARIRPASTGAAG